MTRSRFLGAAITLTLFLNHSLAQLGWPTTITARNVRPFDQFGGTIAIDSDCMVVGAPRGNFASVFRWNGMAWAEEAILKGTDTVTNDWFGSSVAIENDVIVVTARAAAAAPFTEHGAAYVFRRGAAGWAQEAKLIPPNGSNGFYAEGVRVSRGRVVLVGGFGAGRAVNVFRHENGGWVHEQRFVTDNVNRTFGSALALQADTLVIASFGSPGVDGVAKIYRRSGTTWSLSQTILPTGLNFPDQFGKSLSIDADLLVLGLPNESRAHIYRQIGATWVFEASVTPPTTAYFNVGASVHVRGSEVAMSSEVLLNGTTPVGRVHVLERLNNVWVTTGMVGDGTTAEDVACAIGPRCVAIGQYDYTHEGFSNAGRVQVFSRAENQWLAGPTTIVRTGGMPATQGLGISVAIAGNLVAGGSYLDDEGQVDSGSVRTVRRTGTHFDSLGRIAHPTPGVGDTFGRSVALFNGSTPSALGGAPQRDVAGRANQGAAYYFPSATNSADAVTLTAADGAAADAFGTAVGLGNNICVVSATGDDTGAAVNHGSVYVFQISTGAFPRTATQTAKLQAPTLVSSDLLGTSVAIEGDTIVVGASGRSSNRGAAYIYEKRSTNVWELVAELLAPDGIANDRFGAAVAIHGDRIVIGANTKAIGANAGQGAAYIFARSGLSWTYVTRLTAPSGATGDSFGISVALTGRNVVVGASGDDLGAAIDAGSLYVFTSASDTAAGPWTDVRKFTLPAPASNDRLGSAVATDATTIVAGAWGSRSGAGELLIFDFADTQQNTVVFGPGNTTAPTVATAIATAPAGSRVLAAAGSLSFTNLDLASKPVDLSSRTSILMPSWSDLALAHGSALRAPYPCAIDLLGSVTTPNDLGRSSISAGSIRFWPSGTLVVGNHQLQLQSPSIQVDAPTTLLPNAMLTATGDLRFNSTLNAVNVATVAAGKDLVIAGITNFRGVNLSAGDKFIVRGSANLTSANVGSSFNHIQSGAVVNFGGLFSGFTQNDGKLILTSFSAVYGGFTNSANAMINLAGGSFNIYGPYTNSGTVIGTPTGCTNCLSSGNLLTIEDSLTMASTGSVFFTGTMEIGGSLFSDLTQATNFDLRGATLRFSAAGATSNRTIEAMSHDYGPASQAMRPTVPHAFPIATLEIGPGSTTVTLRDNSDNDEETQAHLEAVYVEHLIVHAGSRLNTAGINLYTRSAEIRGTVDIPSNIIPLGDPCPADLVIDARVDDADFSAFIAGYDLLDCAHASMPTGCPADFNSDLMVDDADFTFFAIAYNALLCP